MAIQDDYPLNCGDNGSLPSGLSGNDPQARQNLTASHGNGLPLNSPLVQHPSPIASSVPESIGSGSKSSLGNGSSNSASISNSKSRIEKRTANTLAARRYRQKRLDKVAELEAAIEETRRERDTLKLQVAKLQGETQILRGLVKGP